ncbi:MAG: ABC transporter permease [Propioniciclava sp.]
MTTVSFPPAVNRWTRLRRRHAWVVAIAGLLAALLALRATQIPSFGGFELRTLIAGSLAMALLGMAQAVVVISGGVNMSVGALLVLANCVCARLMAAATPAQAWLIALGVILGCGLLSALIGWVVTRSGIPDIVVTLAASFIIAGGAFLVLPQPGGGIPTQVQQAVVGGFSQPVPATVTLAAVLGLIWLPYQRSRWGVATYAIGSDRRAAYLAGVDVSLARIRAYALSGVLAGLAGFATTAFTGGGEPRASIGLTALLASIAAVVLGGVGLTGGSGGLLGPALAALVLGLIPPLMLGFGWDPNLAEVARGSFLILVVLIGGLAQRTGAPS